MTCQCRKVNKKTIVSSSSWVITMVSMAQSIYIKRPHQEKEKKTLGHDLERHCSGVLFAWLNLSFSLAGNADVVPPGKNRLFLGYPYCRKSLGLEVGKTYLFMGTSADIRREVENNVVTWVCPLEGMWVVFGCPKYFCSAAFWPNQDDTMLVGCAVCMKVLAVLV